MELIRKKRIDELWKEYQAKNFDKDKINCGIDLEEFDELIAQVQLQEDAKWLKDRAKRERYIKELQVWKLEVWLTPEEYKQVMEANNE